MKHDGMIDRYRRQVALTLLLVAGALVLLAGCSGDEDPVVPSPDPLVEPKTPEELLAGFQAAYEARDAAGYLALLDPDFTFVLRQATADAFPELGPALDFDLEERIHQRMFSGEAVTDPDGEPRPGVLQVYFNSLSALDGWMNTDDAATFPESSWAPFEVDLVVDCGPQFTTYKAKGQLKVYVRRHTRMAGGKEVVYFKLAGMVDLTASKKGVEPTPWGLIKAYYR